MAFKKFKFEIKNLTIKEIVRICHKQYACSHCPLLDICGKLIHTWKKEDLEKEIEL